MDTQYTSMHQSSCGYVRITGCVHRLSANMYLRVTQFYSHTVHALCKLEFGLQKELLHKCSDKGVIQLPVDVAAGVRNDAEGDFLHLVDDELCTAG